MKGQSRQLLTACFDAGTLTSKCSGDEVKGGTDSWNITSDVAVKWFKESETQVQDLSALLREKMIQVNGTLVVFEIVEV